MGMRNIVYMGKAWVLRHGLLIGKCLVAAVFCLAAVFYVFYGKAQNPSMVYEQVLRFHIRANSDCEEDQRVKLLVKDAVIHEAQVILLNEESAMGQGSLECLTKEETKRILGEHLDSLKRVAAQVLREQGKDEAVSIYFTKEEFPVKCYGDMTFPAGMYEALRIDLGNGKGHNWWCMLYPSLCFYDSSYGVVSEESKQVFSDLLPAEDYEELLSSDDTNIEVKSGILKGVLSLFDN